jgi:hypothetical protein
MFSSLVFGLVCVSGPAQVEVEPILLSRADAIVELHVQRLANEPILKGIARWQGKNTIGQFLSQVDFPPECLDDIGKFLHEMQIDFWSDIERLTIGGSLNRDLSSWPIILTGKFDPPRIKAGILRMAWENPERMRFRYEGPWEVWLWSPSGSDGQAWNILLLDSRTLIFSANQQALKNLADRVFHPEEKSSRPLQLLLDRGREKHLLTIVARTPAVLKTMARHTPVEYALWNLQDYAKDVSAVSLGLLADKGFKLELTMRAVDAQSAQRMRAQMCRWRFQAVSALKNQNPKDNVAKALLAFRFDSDGPVLSIRGPLPAR